MSDQLIKLYSSKLFLLFETVLFVVIPVLILTAKPELFRYYILLLFVFVPYALFIIKTQIISAESLGISKRNFFKSAKYLFVSTLLFLLLTYSIVRFLPIIFNFDDLFRASIVLYFWKSGKVALVLAYLFVYAILASPLQELIFRGYQTSRLELVSKNRVFLLLYTSLTFASFHLPSRSIPVVLGTFLLGLMWEWDFIKNRNLATLSLSHVAVGIFFVANIILLFGKP